MAYRKSQFVRESFQMGGFFNMDISLYMIFKKKTANLASKQVES